LTNIVSGPDLIIEFFFQIGPYVNLNLVILPNIKHKKLSVQLQFHKIEHGDITIVIFVALKINGKETIVNHC